MSESAGYSVTINKSGTHVVLRIGEGTTITATLTPSHAKYLSDAILLAIKTLEQDHG